MTNYDDDTDGMSKDEKIVHEAQERFKRAAEWESESRVNWVDDMKFANGDSINMNQWYGGIVADRNNRNAPCLTINKTKQHCLQIINDQRQNQSQVEVRPVGNGASYEAAKVFEGIVRHIEYESNAQAAYSNACYGQVISGIGYWRVTTDYASDDSFDQEIFIKRVQDALSIYLDCDIQEADGSDAKWGFVFKEMPRDEFERDYGDEDDLNPSAAPLTGAESGSYDSWDTRVCEYFRRTMTTDKLHELDNGMTVKESEVKDANLMDQLKINSTRSRDIETPQIEWFLIAGNKIIEKKQWLGKYIPIVRVIGEETIIDKRLDRRGHTRALLDPQRIYNYWSSSAVECVALQTKSPYITSIEAINSFEQNWASANIENAAYLPYNGMDASGQKIDPPAREPPPVMSQAYLEGMKISAGEMQLVTGQYEANMGQKSNEVSGTAVDARQRQGENATYHYIDRFAQAIRYTGRILVDLIPKVYDTERVMKILAENGDQTAIQISPNAPQAHQKVQDPDDEGYDPQSISAIFNPTVGQYDVEADIGPAYSTRRQETFRALSQLLQTDTSLVPLIGDIMLMAADFPMADIAAERLRRMVPDKALGKGPDPQVAELQQMLAKTHDAMTKLQTENITLKNKASEHGAKTDIETYKSETERMKAIGMIDPEAMMPVIRQLISEALGTPINPIIAAHAQENAQMAQRPEAPPSPIAPPPEPAPQGSSQ